MQTDFWVLRAISNLHAGSGDADFGIVDKHVQRDTVTGLPTIYASGIKGALRQVFDTQLPGQSVGIFGSDNSSTGGGQAQNLQQGSYFFYNAKLLALPVRSSHRFYYLATCPDLINELRADLIRFQHPDQSAIRQVLKGIGETPVDSKGVYFGPKVSGLTIEDTKPQHSDWPAGSDPENMYLQQIFGPDFRLCLFDSATFSELNQELPTLARNHLDNGVSTNLWYEEIVPRETRFYLPIGRPAGEDHLAKGIKEKRKNLIQIGGNATVGYGLCEWIKL